MLILKPDQVSSGTHLFDCPQKNLSLGSGAMPCLALLDDISNLLS